MAKWATEHGGDREIDEKKQKLTADVMEAVAWSGSFCGRSN